MSDARTPVRPSALAADLERLKARLDQQRGARSDLHELNRRIASIQATLDARTLPQSPSPLAVATTAATAIHGHRRRGYALISAAQLLTVLLLSVTYPYMDETNTRNEAHVQPLAAPPASETTAAEPEPHAGVPEPQEAPEDEPVEAPPNALPPGDSSPESGDIIIDSFPFQDERNTALSNTRRADTYACSPATREDGPEYWYEVNVSEAGQLIASIEEDMKDGIDVDVHLLSEPHPSSCIARANSELAVDVVPGRYWLVLDTYTADGIEKVGPYRLTVYLK